MNANVNCSSMVDSMYLLRKVDNPYVVFNGRSSRRSTAGESFLKEKKHCGKPDQHAYEENEG